MIGLVINFLNNIFKYFITISFVNGINNQEILHLLFVNYFISTISGNLVFIGTVSFNFRMCDHCIAGTFLTILFSVRNFGGQWTGSFVLFLSNYLSFQNQFYISNIVFVAYFLSLYKIIISWEKSDKKDWKLE